MLKENVPRKMVTNRRLSALGFLGIQQVVGNLTLNLIGENFDLHIWHLL